MRGRDRCRFHGGATPRGYALPHTKHGRYSKDLPTQLAGRYEEALTDVALLELRSEVALVDARLSDLLARLGTGEAGSVWKRLRRCAAAFDRARRQRDTDGAAEALTDLMALIRRGASEHALWTEIREALTLRRQLVESERKRLVEMQQMITSEQAMLLVSAVVATVKRHVTDRDVLRDVSRDLASLTDHGRIPEA